MMDCSNRLWVVIVLGVSAMCFQPIQLHTQGMDAKLDTVVLDTKTVRERVSHALLQREWPKAIKMLKRLGVQSRNQGSFLEAQQIFREVYQIEHRHTDVSPATWYNLGLLKMDLDEPDSVLHFLIGCEDAILKSGEMENLEMLYHLRSQHHFEQKDFHEALVDLEWLENKYLDTDMQYLLGTILFRQARCLLELKDAERALPLLDRCLEIAEEVDLEDPMLDRIQRMRDQIRGDDNGASVSANTMTQDWSEFGDYRKYRLLLKQMERRQMETEMEFQTVLLSKQRNTIKILIAAASLFLIVLFALWKSNSQVKKQKKTISQALEDRETLLREIHHRVKNNLQIISSLLSLQSRTLIDENAISALIDGRSRVESMALIHQDLYEEDNLTGIDVEGYIEKLCRNLYATYNVNGDRVKLDLDIEPIILDVNTLIPLGLILNELISNALKYAFPNDRTGNLTIRMHDDGNQLCLKVQDNGIGIHDQTSKGFGRRLIHAFAKKLDAAIEVQNLDGLTVAMKIQNYKVA